LSEGKHNSLSAVNNKMTQPVVEYVKTKNGAWTAFIRDVQEYSFYLHSRYDPVKEAENFINGQIRHLEEEKLDKIIVYGTGCGHHIRALLNNSYTDNIPLEVWETNIIAFTEAKQKGIFSDLLEDSRIIFKVSNDVTEFVNSIKNWQNRKVHVIVHEPSLKCMPRELKSFKEVLQDYQMKQNTAVAFRHLLDTNFAENNREHWPGVNTLSDITSVPAILISSGPSLLHSLSKLKEAGKHCLLGAVGSAAATLCQNGIRPDFVVMSDPQANMLSQLQGWETEQIPLFFLSTLYSGVVEEYRGPKFILYQEGYQPAEDEAKRRSEPVVQTGGSVATTMFSLARLLNLYPICLIGQDLAYTNNSTHVASSPQNIELIGQLVGEKVMAFDQRGTVVAPRNLLIYKKWFEEQARASNDTFYNATEGGAYIEGFIHVTLEEFLHKVQSFNAAEAREKFRHIVRSTTT